MEGVLWRGGRENEKEAWKIGVSGECLKRKEK
jgi:hypothetical protein